MRNVQALILLFLLMALPIQGFQEPDCVAPALSEQKVKELIDKERATRKDLPAPFPEYRWVVRRQGCHYVYIEYGLPETPDYNNIFRLNQHGVLVDAPGNPKCPDKVLTEAELAEAVKKERAKRKNLPAPFPNSKPRVSRLRCMYLYFEYAQPEVKGKYHAFTIDPFGEVVEFSRGKVH